MKILNEEHFQNVKRYAESIGDTSLQNCLDRLKNGRRIQTIQAKSRSIMIMPRTRSASRNAIQTEASASWAVCSTTEYPTNPLL